MLFKRLLILVGVSSMQNKEHNNALADEQVTADVELEDLDDAELQDDSEDEAAESDSYSKKELQRQSIAQQIEQFLLQGGSIDVIESKDSFRSNKNAQ